MFFVMIQQNVMILLMAQQIVMFFLMIQQNVIISLQAQRFVMFFLMIKKLPEIKKKFNFFLKKVLKNQKINPKKVQKSSKKVQIPG